MAEKQRKEQQYQSTLNSKSPRTMYLLGAQMEDKGESGKAQELYRKIMSAFPDSDFAIKASDRLARMRDGDNARSRESERADSARRLANEQQRANERAGQSNKQACENQKNSCLANCEGYSDNDKEHGFAASSRSKCRMRCFDIRC